MRLDKFISQQLEVSRAIAGREIRAQNVTVDGEIVREAAFKVTADHEVAHNGNVLHMQQGPRYFMLNKPEGYICATEDEVHQTILYFIDEPMAWKLHAAGRLDIDTTGLVLLTDDGQWSHRLTSPKHHCDKTYRVTTAEPVTDELIAAFEQGFMLNGEKEPTRPAQVELIDTHEVLVTISEGRYHQIKRMFAAQGNHVEQLHREKIGEITLDDDLEPGEYRPLTEDEILSVGLPPELQKPLAKS